MFRPSRIVGREKADTSTLTKRTERCAVARREPYGGHAAQHLSNIEMASRRLCPPYGSMWPEHALGLAEHACRKRKIDVAAGEHGGTRSNRLNGLSIGAILVQSKYCSRSNFSEHLRWRISTQS